MPGRFDAPSVAVRRLSRRGFAAASVGAAGAAALGGGLAGVARPAAAGGAGHAGHGAGWSGSFPLAAIETLASAPQLGAGPNRWAEPPTLASSGGVLEVELEAAPLPAAGTGRMAYAGLIPGPTLRFRPGDTVAVTLTNALGGDTTNLHVHGLHVSPEGNGDNVFVMVEDGERFTYVYDIPANHPAGTYWYHPHHHGDSWQQVGAGLAGLMVVEGGLDDLPGLTALPERLWALQGPQRTPDGFVYTVNGVNNPAVPLRPGQTERWRLANVSANAYFNLALDGHPFHLVGLDGNPLPARQEVEGIVLGPGERAQVLVRAERPGTFLLRSRAWGEGGQKQGEFAVATVEVGGEPVEPAPLPEALVPLEDLAGVAVDNRRTVVFQEGYGGLPYSIDGVAFDPDVVNTVVKLGAVEEWELRNDSPEWHPFHIHVNDFQVMTVNGTPFGAVNRQDTVSLPPGGSVTIRTRFAEFVGTFVYHCHILTHEDFGMMAVVEVVP
jgi:FtsP/CotA-like multicopper oxidase with cupredoxin domain